MNGARYGLHPMAKTHAAALVRARAHAGMTRERVLVEFTNLGGATSLRATWRGMRGTRSRRPQTEGSATRLTR